MAHFHKNLTQKKWNGLARDKQILNIGSELMRAQNWLKKKNYDYLRSSLDRAFELIDLTVSDKKWRMGQLKEILRFREILGNYYLGTEKNVNEFNKLLKHFFNFTPAGANLEV